MDKVSILINIQFKSNFWLQNPTHQKHRRFDSYPADHMPEQLNWLERAVHTRKVVSSILTSGTSHIVGIMTITQPSDTRKDEICTVVRADMYSAATRDRLVRLQYRAPKFDFIIKIIYNKYTISKEKRYASLAQSGLRATGFYPVCRRFKSFKGRQIL